MKHYFIIALLMTALPATAFGQTPNSDKAPPAKPGQEIVNLEHEWMDAMKNRDKKTLNRLVASEFTLGGAIGAERPEITREDWMENTMTNLKIDSVAFDRMKVHVYDNTAVVQTFFTWKGAFMGDAFTDKVELKDVWVRRGGQWQVVIRFVEPYKEAQSTK